MQRPEALPAGGKTASRDGPGVDLHTVAGWRPLQVAGDDAQVARHSHPPPAFSKVALAAFVWFVIGGLGVMLILWLSGAAD
ncbi:hypothetical protein GCM10027610_095040 [Dactylosporangium cerinum]